MPALRAAVVLAVLALLVASHAASLAAAKPPNIVVIVSDDQGYHDLGCAGCEEIKTPNLDRLAKGGTRLTSFYVTWPACTPSRASLMTGRYPQRNGTYDMFRNYLVDVGHKFTPEEYAVSPENILGTDVREVFFSVLLKQAGYTNGVFGKWDTGQLKRFLPLQRGFDEFYGFAHTGIDYFTHERYSVPSMWRNNKRTTEDKGTYATDLFRREAVRFLKEHHDQPFFLYLPFNAPHGASTLEKGKGGRGWVQAPEKYLKQYPPGANTREEKRRYYMAAVTCMDDAIGEVLDLLEEYGVADNTLVIFFSDNGGGGGSDNRPLRGHKGQMFEGGVRVPGIVRWPGKVPAGQVSDAFLTSLEVFPTVCSAAGVHPPQNVTLDGFDMLPILQGEKPSPRREMFWQRRSDRGARVGHWKWVQSKAGSGLFDLSQDIGEQRDLSQEKPDVLRMVQDRFAAWQKAMQAAEPRRPFRDF